MNGTRVFIDEVTHTVGLNEVGYVTEWMKIARQWIVTVSYPDAQTHKTI